MSENKKIFVTRPFLPPVDEYQRYIAEIYGNGILTNQGPLLSRLEVLLGQYLNVENFHYVANGTIALDIALRALDITSGEVITTPFSYVATTSSILWERCNPVFVDIEPDNFTIDVSKIEMAITEKTRAIMAVHVFGYACDVTRIEEIARKYNLKVIYDGAHAFGSKYNGVSLLNYGDISTLSFHATKLFHTVEGGGCIVKDSDVSNRLDLIKRFGHSLDEYIMLGTNAKNSELHAAMGLANFPYVFDIIKARKDISQTYDSHLRGCLRRPSEQAYLEYNYAYYPVVFETETELLHVFSLLNSANIYPRRYFFPSLNTLPYLDKRECCPVSEDIASRVACLPIYVGLGKDDVVRISSVIRDGLAR